MASFNRTKMCAECPFRKKAPAGWLGPWTIAEMEEFYQFDGDFICHVEVKQLQDNGLSEEEIDEQGEHCVGMLRYMNGSCKRSRDPEKFAAQKGLEKIKDQPVIEPWKFRQHHESKLGSVDKSE